MNNYNIPFVRIFEYAVIINIDKIEFGKYIIIDSFTHIHAGRITKLGNYVHIAPFSSVGGGGDLIMEDFSGVSSGVRLVTGSDDFQGRGFGHPAIDNSFRNVKQGTVRLGKFSIVGANSIILPDVEIGEGAAVAAGSVVSKNLNPWGIYMGNRKVGERDREGILENYKRFMNTEESERVGRLFKT